MRCGFGRASPSAHRGGKPQEARRSSFGQSAFGELKFRHPREFGIPRDADAFVRAEFPENPDFKDIEIVILPYIKTSRRVRRGISQKTRASPLRFLRFTG